MINLHGKISVKNMSGFLNVVPTKGEAMLQVKRVEPTYEEQEVVPDAEDGYAGLSKVVVGPKDRPLIEIIATDKIANHVLSSGGVVDTIVIGKKFPKYSYNGIVLPQIPADVLANYPYAWIRENGNTGYYDLAVTALLGYYNPNVSTTNGGIVYGENAAYGEVVQYRVPIADAGTASVWEYLQTTNGWMGLDSNRVLLWSNHDIPNGSATATEIYFAGSDPILVEE